MDLENILDAKKCVSRVYICSKRNFWCILDAKYVFHVYIYAQNEISGVFWMQKMRFTYIYIYAQNEVFGVFLVLTKMSKKGFRHTTDRHTDRQTPKHPLSKCIKNNVFSMSTKSDSWHTYRERENKGDLRSQLLKYLLQNIF